MWPESNNTEHLINRAKRGEEGIVDQLLEGHRESLRRLVGMRLDPKIRRRVDVSDIVQDAIIEANRRFHDYLQNPVIPFHLWLRQIAKDRIIDAYRRHHAAEKRSVDREQPLAAGATFDRSTIDIAAQLCSPELTPAATAAMRELAQKFEAAIDELDEQDREMILMRHFEQLSNQEVAQSLELTQPAASMRYLRAMRRLRELLGETGTLDSRDG